MFAIQNYGSFILAVFVFQLIPGAGTVTILNAAARRGVGGGMKAVCGTLSGDFIYMLSAVLGLAAILSTIPGILETARWIGVGYLCWMGLRLLLKPTPDQPAPAETDRIGWADFRQALAVSLTNPKVIMFFMAFFPLFLGPGSTPATLFILMAHVTVISFFYQAGLVLAGNAVARRLSRWRCARLAASRLAGLALISFGVKLALSSR